MAAVWALVDRKHSEYRAFPAEYDDSRSTVTLSGEYDPDTGSFDKNRKDVLTYSRPDLGHLELRGNFGKQQVVIEWRKMDLSKFTLLSRKFHWIENGGYYR